MKKLLAIILLFILSFGCGKVTDSHKDSIYPIIVGSFSIDSPGTAHYIGTVMPPNSTGSAFGFSKASTASVDTILINNPIQRGIEIDTVNSAQMNFDFYMVFTDSTLNDSVRKANNITINGAMPELKPVGQNNNAIVLGENGGAASFTKYYIQVTFNMIYNSQNVQFYGSNDPIGYLDFRVFKNDTTLFRVYRFVTNGLVPTLDQMGIQ